MTAQTPIVQPVEPVKPQINNGAGVSVPSIMLLGSPGSGKTYSLMSLLEAGLKVFVLSTEANGVEILLDSFRNRKKANASLNIDNLYYKTIAPTVTDLTTMLKKARISNSMGVEDMQKLQTGLDRDKYPQYMNVIRSLADLKCDRTGRSVGNVGRLGPDWAFVMDSLTGFTTMVVQSVKGNRPTMTRPEFGVAQEHVRDLVTYLTSLNCFFVMTTHLARETNEVTNQERVMASTVGKALAPTLPETFSDVILAYRDGTNFLWSTTHSEMDLKQRNLEFSHKITPDFAQIVERYRERVKLAAEGGIEAGLN